MSNRIKILFVLFVSFVVSQLSLAGVDATEPAHYPEFSWDHVPRYMHLRKAEAFNQEELHYLSKFPIITLEKTTGQGTYGSTELGSREAAKGIKAINPNAKVLYYRNIMVHYGGYAINDNLINVKQPFLRNNSGETKLIRNRVQAYDLRDSSLQDWWLDHCFDMASYPEIDGIFIDGNIKALEPAFLKREIGEDNKADVKEAYAQMMMDLDEGVGPDKLLIANLIRARLPNSGLDYIQNFDGSYIEGFEAEANGLTKLEYVAKGIAAIQKAAREGNIICFSMGLGKALDVGLKIDDTRAKLEEGSYAQERLTYALAIFLICAEKYSYFLPHDGYSVNRNDSSVWLKDFPEFERPLGPPMGPAKLDGYVYTREFEHASVWLDIEKDEARVEWNR
ncbi:MAG: putative glycoside hydrolase [Puniceicoccaceae bacterium]